ncbi:MAG: hypothetical protein AB7S38_39395 [Vulcanimicrobiota bacterium]
MLRKLALLVLLLSVVAQAQTPEQKLETLYKYHLSSHGEPDTVAKHERFFTPGFLGVLDRQFELQRQLPGAGSNFLTVGNGGWGDYEVHPGARRGKDYVVPMVLYCGLRSDQVRTDPKVRAEWPVHKVEILFTDIGAGWQIYDLRFLPRPASKNGYAFEGYSAREMLKRENASIAKHLEKYPELRR